MGGGQVLVLLATRSTSEPGPGGVGAARVLLHAFGVLQFMKLESGIGTAGLALLRVPEFVVQAYLENCSASRVRKSYLHRRRSLWVWGDAQPATQDSRDCTVSFEGTGRKTVTQDAPWRRKRVWAAGYQAGSACPPLPQRASKRKLRLLRSSTAKCNVRTCATVLRISLRGREPARFCEAPI